MQIMSVPINVPEGANIVIGQSHFIKSVEDIFEAVVTTVPQAKFGIAFAEASGPCLVRHDGNDSDLENEAVKACLEIGAGHSFVLILKGAYPINVLNRLKEVQEVCSIYCATANAIEVVVAQAATGRGILGVVDGSSPRGVEGDVEKADRVTFLQRIGYKR
uniref:Adenosine monophosphate-protein transferase n=1 Tax=Candidatus Methanomethylicus mesodigestus TaxID=1867258 RepID=A0A7C3N8T9_9CREN